MSSMMPVDWNPSEAKLRQFSTLWLIFVGIAWPVILHFRGHPHGAAAAVLVGVLGGLLGWIRPGWMRPAWVALIAVSWPIGWIVTNVALGILYFGIITPIALVARIMGRDALHLSGWRSTPTTWRARAKVDLGRYLREH